MVVRVTEVQEFEVGRYYSVPCLQPTTAVWCRLKYLPVLGDWHEDSTLNFPVTHIHYDWRFFPKAALRLIGDESSPYWGLPDPMFVYAAARPHVAKPPIRWLKRQCKRLELFYPTELAIALEPQFKDASVGCDRRCPHKGVLLNGLPISADGGMVCPGHGLKWHSQSGRLIPRCLEEG
jgi:hypothetical protein